MNLAQWFRNLRHRFVEFLYRLRFQRAVAGLETPPPATRAFVVLQIDALAFSALQEVLERGDMPPLARLLQQGEYRLRRWRFGSPPPTTATAPTAVSAITGNRLRDERRLR